MNNIEGKKKKNGKFLLGALVGAAIGVLFAPAKGSETRRALKSKLDDLLAKTQEIDLSDLKEEFDDKVEEIRASLEDLDKEKVVKFAKKKADELKGKAQELLELAKAKGTPILQDAAKDVLEKVVEVSQEALKKLETKK